MIQIIGLTFLTLGSILLGLSVFRVYLRDFLRFLKWDNLPWESKVVLRLLYGVKENNFLKKIIESNEKWPLGKELKNLTIPERISVSMPILAIVLIVIGYILSLVPMLVAAMR